MGDGASEEWPELRERYRQYRALPFWGTKTFRPDEKGILPNDLRAKMRQQGEAAAERVREAITRLLNVAWFPRDPNAIQQQHFDRIARERLLPGRLREALFTAVVFDRGDYTCRYCGRNVDRVWEESGHRWTIWLEIDHCLPRVTRGASDLENCVPACQRCNMAKGSLPERPFMEELLSIARSVLGRRPDARNLSVVCMVALGAAVAAGCGPFVEVVRLDDATRSKVRLDVKQFNEPPMTYRTIQHLEATSCRSQPWHAPASNEDAIDQLRFKAAGLGANGLTDVFCDSEGVFDLGKNCWSSVKCRGTAIEVPR